MLRITLRNATGAGEGKRAGGDGKAQTYLVHRPVLEQHCDSVRAGCLGSCVRACMRACVPVAWLLLLLLLVTCCYG